MTQFWERITDWGRGGSYAADVRHVMHSTKLASSIVVKQVWNTHTQKYIHTNTNAHGLLTIIKVIIALHPLCAGKAYFYNCTSSAQIAETAFSVVNVVNPKTFWRLESQGSEFSETMPLAHSRFKYTRLPHLMGWTRCKYRCAHSQSMHITPILKYLNLRNFLHICNRNPF